MVLLQLYIRRSFFCPPKRLNDYHGLVKENARAEQQVRGRATTSCLAKARELRTATRVTLLLTGIYDHVSRTEAAM